MKQTNVYSILLSAIFALTTACAGSKDNNPLNTLTGDSNSSLGESNSDGSNSKDPLDSDFKLGICSDLSFDNVAWPTQLSEFQINAFALGMNITGSFEGHSGWHNISNNFDQQGLSMGLFNQNFGQGSLQPLLGRTRDQNSSVLKNIFSSAQLKSLLAMVAKWEGKSTGLSKAISDSNLDSDFSSLDMDEARVEETPVFQKAAGNRNKISVAWAVKNLYTDSRGRNFRSSWKQAMIKLAKTPEYISHQVYAADRINQKALNYMKTYGAKSLRSYLFFFDIVVQNGGISSSIKKKYLAEIRKKPGIGEYTKMTILLKHRLTLVRKQYRKDVSLRKMSILNGSGTVHGAKRDYRKEFCVSDWRMPFEDDGALILQP